MPESTPLAVVFALVAALGYAGAAVLQQREAAAQPAETAMRLGLLARLLTNPRWLLGFACDWGAFGAEAIALGFGTIVLVAPLMQTGLLFALFLGARLSHRPLQRPDWLAAFALAVGLAVFLVIADPAGGITRPSWTAWWPWLLAMGLAVIACIAIGRISVGATRAVAWGCAAAICYGISGPLTKTVVELLGSGRFVACLTSWELYTLVAAALFGMLCNQSAFQAGNLPASLPIIAIGTPLFGCVIGVLVYDEHLRATGALEFGALVVAIAVMVIGILILARREGSRQASPTVSTTS